MAALERHLKTLPIEQIFVVINTLDTQFEKDASKFCEDLGIEYRVTESNGTASRGKNLMFDLFESSNHDYAVCVDGDDYITEYGCELYNTLVSGPKVPDVVAMINQWGIKRSLVSLLLTEEEENGESIDPDSIAGSWYHPFKRDEMWFDTMYRFGEGHPFYEWARQCQAYIMPFETHLRFSLISKKAVKLFRFDENFKVGEDTLMYLNFKKAWSEGLIDLVHFDEKETPSYIYDSRVGGVVVETSGENESQGKHPLSWVKPLIEEYQRYEDAGKMVSDIVPVIN